MKDYYRLLGIEPEATGEEVRRAYRDRAQKAMWDRPRFVELSEAFETLKDTAKRAAYDQQWYAANGVESPPAPDEPAPREQEGAADVTGLADAAAAITVNEPAAGSADRTQGLALPPCPVCRTPGTPGEEFCIECGFLVGATPGPAAPERPLPHLVDGTGRRFALKAGENTVGREGADVILPDRTVSRRHALLMVEPGGDVWLEDTGSTNGTQRAGRPLPAGQRATLSDGTELQFGAVKMTLRTPDAPLALPLPDIEPVREPVAALNPPEGEEEPVAKLVGKGGQVYALTEKVSTFGRRATNHFVISGDPYVSGAHAQVVYEEDGFRLIDVGSTNGTQLNGRRLIAHAPSPLVDGDEVILGQTPLMFYTRLGK